MGSLGEAHRDLEFQGVPEKEARGKEPQMCLFLCTRGETHSSHACVCVYSSAHMGLDLEKQGKQVKGTPRDFTSQLY